MTGQPCSDASRSSWTWPARLWLIGILTVGPTLRAATLWATEPLIWPDSGGYLYLAQGLVSGDLSRAMGVRTPAYPLLIILAGNDIHRTVFFQAVIGLGITVLIFWISWTITHNHLAAALASLAYALDVNQIQYEISILTETLTAFLLLVSLVLLILAWRRMEEGAVSGWYFWAIGLTSGLVLLTRPIYVFVPFVLFLATLCKAFALKLDKLKTVFIVIPSIGFILGWSAFNYWRLGYFGFTTLLGFALTDITGSYIEFAPQEYSQIRDIYMAYRPAQIAIFHLPIGTQWASVHEMAIKTGLSAVEISKAYTRMSLYLIFRHLDLYASVAWQSWLSLWRPHVLQSWPIVIAPKYRFEQLRNVIWMLQTPLYQALNYLFLLLSYGIFVWSLWLRPDQLMAWIVKDQKLTLITIGSIAILSALLSSLLSFGEPRYSIPVRPLIPIVVFSTAWLALRRCRHSRRSTPANGTYF